MNAHDMLGYAGARVIVSGCASGMGKATARLLLDLGAEVHGLDYQTGDLPLHSFATVDLRASETIGPAIAAIGGPIDALFNCAGLGPIFPAADILAVNFLGTRALTEGVLPLMKEGGAIASIASTAARGWGRRLALLKQFIGIADYADAARWAQENGDAAGEAYSFSKEAVVVWTLQASQTLIKRGIRINCVLPGLTQTPMLTDQIAIRTSATILDTVIQPFGRAATPEEQAFPMVMINSKAAGYINGAALNVDGGRLAAEAICG